MHDVYDLLDDIFNKNTWYIYKNNKINQKHLLYYKSHHLSSYYRKENNLCVKT